MPSQEIQSFLSWFQAHNGYIDTNAMDIVPLPPSEGGRGAVALIDIPENHTLFSVPRSMILTTRTSELPPRFGPDAWTGFGLHLGWSGLILCLMWEAARGAESKWAPYFEIMPTKFDTPMFWNEEDMAELKGTSVVDKLGKDLAEKDYHEKIVPAIQSRPDLFPPESLATHYSLEVYHMMGTRVLSRSFTLAEEEVEDEDEDDHHALPPKEDGAAHPHVPESPSTEEAGNTSLGSAMDVDEPAQGTDAAAHDQEHESETADANEPADGGSESDSDEEDAPEVAMVPMADILNARYKHDNVKLFHERDSLRMVSTRPIKAGEQIWNTYGDLPNSDLLRGFGHVDYMPLPYAPGEYGNPGDVVEVRADVIVQCALDYLNGDSGGDGEGSVNARREKKATTEDMTERIDWWLEEGGDDIFLLEHPTNITPPPSQKQKSSSASASTDPTALLTSSLSILPLSFIQLLLQSPSEFAKTQAKAKPPKPSASLPLLRVLLSSLDKRASMYPTTLEEDERLVKETEGGLEGMSLNKRHAMIVRMGEKRVLRDVRRCVEGVLQEVERREKEDPSAAEKAKGAAKKVLSRAEKRKAERAEGGGGKRRK
ncbi:hypothetical protein CVT26_011162 [Gymnopilus dilepis]|uniref:SET domain-containing protein n=1 Tax=Gymnopilus dilepis TaxID=231916 RepID=A0A409VJ91_9AGAR|nr:hypothetical protein CVT26_011162 [Gymnopilus dilepis]